MLHVVVYGPPKSGKTSVAQALRKEHKRAIVNLNELLDWNTNSGTPAATKAVEFLE
jgi:replication-associated recombination protein RarA